LIDAVESDLRGEAAGDAGATLVAASSVSTVATIIAIVAIAAVVSVFTIVAISTVATAGVFLECVGSRVGGGDGSGVVYDRAGSGVDFEGVVVAGFAGSFFERVVGLRFGICSLRRFVALTWPTATAAATATTPATTSIRAGCALA
jgi:hypothetical protein